MKIQAPLDLCTFELSRFRIWNQSSTPNDFGVGTKYLNTNSGHEAYSREQIYTSTGWRTAAYLDDIDKITNGEGSLGTRVKALEDMLKMDDASDAINTWAEIQKFLENIDEGLDLMTMLDGKAEWSIDIPIDNFKSIGYGTQSSDGWKYYGPAISFGANRNYYAQLQVNHQADQIAFRRHTTEGFYDWKNLIHEGNIGSYKAGDSAKLNGKEARYYMDSFMLSTGTDLNTNLVSEARPYIATLYDSNHPNQPDSKLANGNILHIASPSAQTAWELIAGFGSSSPLMFRCGTWKADGTGSINTRDWKTIAFTDSTVAAAKRLVDSNNSAVVHVGESGFYVGDNTYKTLSTSLMGNSILFRTGSSATTVMTITEEGFVGIGNGIPIAPLTVAPKDNVKMQLGTTNGIAFAIQNKSQAFGINFNVESTGVGNIQVGRTKDSATAYALNLNPLGGAVNVASANALTNVLGQLNVGSSSAGCINMVGSSVNYLWADNVMHIGLSTVGGQSGDNATLTIRNDGIHSGFRNNAVSLGTSSYRWSNVYSVEGNFSGNVRIANDYGLLSTTTSGSVVQMVGITKNNALFVGTDACIVNKMLTSVFGSTIRFYTGASLEERVNTMTLTSSGHVLIGEAVDDADYALNVKGDSYFGGTVYIPTGQKLTIGDATIEYDSIAKAIKVDGNLFTTGTNASGGVGEKGETTGGGGSSVYPVDYTGNGVCDIENIWESEDLAVMVYERNSNNGRWDMILVDTSVAADRILVDFSNAPSSTYKIIIIA